MFKKYGRFSGFFKKAGTYKEKTKPKEIVLSKEEQNAYDAVQRYCLHWGCERMYKNSENHGRKPCRFHPGIL